MLNINALRLIVLFSQHFPHTYTAIGVYKSIHNPMFQLLWTNLWHPPEIIHMQTLN